MIELSWIRKPMSLDSFIQNLEQVLWFHVDTRWNHLARKGPTSLNGKYVKSVIFNAEVFAIYYALNFAISSGQLA